MSSLVRRNYILTRLTEAFSHADRDESGSVLLGSDLIEGIDYFFSKEGPNKIFFAIVGDTDIKDSGPKSSHPTSLKTSSDIRRLKVFFSDIDLRADVVAYFLKAEVNEREIESCALEPFEVDDRLPSFGIIRGTLSSFDMLVRCLYRPIMEEMDTEDWGEASASQRGHFFQSLNVFSGGLEGSIRNMSTAIELFQPDWGIESCGAERTVGPDMVHRSLNLLSEWCLQIDDYLCLNDTDSSSWELGTGSDGLGPQFELHYWENRMQKLASVAEQLNMRNNGINSVVTILATAVRSTSHSSKDTEIYLDTQRVLSLLSQWRDIDSRITAAANEAKDNVRYISTLKRFFEPLYSGNILAIIDILPSLLNSMKVIHTVARYYATIPKITKLFMKLSCQMILSCKLALKGTGISKHPLKIDPSIVIGVIDESLQLNEEYQRQYQSTKLRMSSSPKEKQFDLPESTIFGEFDLFCGRILKLKIMFSTVLQFKSLSLSTHKVKELESVILSFWEYLDAFREEGHDLLDFHDELFDRDFALFNTRVSDLERTMQIYIDRSFGCACGIEQSVSLLRRYEVIFEGSNFRSALESVRSIIFRDYELELQCVECVYEQFKHNPPSSRNLPPVACNIAWARHLLMRVERPMLLFQQKGSRNEMDSSSNRASNSIIGSGALLGSKEAKKIVRTYNKLARTLIAFEYVWYEAWCLSIEEAKAGLQATVIIKHPDTGKYFVNFDKEILQLISEAKYLVKLGFIIPSAARAVLLQEGELKSSYNDMKHMLMEYERVLNNINPVTAQLLTPHVRTVELTLHPGLTTITWTSINIHVFKSQVLHALYQLEELVKSVNDIHFYRIRIGMKNISRSVLISDTIGHAVTLNEFISIQHARVRSVTSQIAVINIAIESAIADLFNIISETPVVRTYAHVNRDLSF